MIELAVIEALQQHGAIRLTFTRRRIPRWRFIAALSVIGVGLAHFAVPAFFDPINELAFPVGTRLHTYVNGAVETAIGLTFLSLRTRPSFVLLYVGYVSYLVWNLLQTRWLGSGGATF